MKSTKTPNIQSENNSWELSTEQLDTRSGPSIEEGELILTGPQWFTFKDKSGMSGDTPQETQEQRQAIQEQIDLGIIKQRPRNTPVIAPNQMGALNPQMQKFMQQLKMSPNTVSSNNTTFRPKVIDQKTGKKRKLSPNDKCPCGSGRKYKKCHGRGQV